MTTDECWKSIEAYTLAGDWNGLLVCADALQELGEEEMAQTIRWANRMKYLPKQQFSPDHGHVLWWWVELHYHGQGSWTAHSSQCQWVWGHINTHRMEGIRHYS
jgi:hypothetical protein